jgi:hypothetical protein
MSGEMWPAIMYQSVAAVGPDVPMQPFSNKGAALYYVVTVVVCNVLMLNLFVSVVVNSFNRVRPLRPTPAPPPTPCA